MADSAPTQELLVSGMTCGHCRVAVETALREVPGVTSVEVDLNEGRAKVDGSAKLNGLISAVQEAGYEAAPVTTK